jgi:sugar/nucleoside kinase (ribokinase family)
MSVDLAVVGSPFLDLVFADLPHAVVPGREVVAGRLLTSPGGTGMQAVAAARSGISVVIVAPRGDDAFGAMLRSVFAAEGVGWIGPRSATTPVTAVLASVEATAMVTAATDGEPSPDDVASADARAVVVSLGRRRLAPTSTAVYAVTGQVELDAGVSLDAVDGSRAVIVNADEAAVLTGYDDPDAASRRLAEAAEIGIVTIGAGGAVATTVGTTLRVAATSVSPGDPTGAGDVFTGAFAAADLRGVELRAALEHAVGLAGRAAAGESAYAGLGPPGS